MEMLYIIVIFAYIAIGVTYALRIPAATGAGVGMLVGALAATSGYLLLAADQVQKHRGGAHDRRMGAIGFVMLVIFFAFSLNFKVVFYDRFAVVGYSLALLALLTGLDDDALGEAADLALVAYYVLGFVYKVQHFQWSEVGHLVGRFVLAAYYAKDFLLIGSKNGGIVESSLL